MFQSKLCVRLISLIACLTFCTVVNAVANEANLNKSLVLKQRLSVLPLSNISEDQEKATVILKGRDPLLLFPEEGVVLERENWASVVDLAKSELSKSDFLRIVEMPTKYANKAIETQSSDHPDLIVLISFGISGKERKFFSRLIETASGQVIYVSDSTGNDLEEAVHKSVFAIDKWLLTQSWRCRVIGIRSDQMIINRGSLDGLREGIELVGYSLKQAPKNRHQEPIEAMLMKYGEKAGLYKVVEVRNDFAKVKAIKGGHILAEGDILEMPEIKLIDRNIKTRGSRTWEKIFDK